MAVLPVSGVKFDSRKVGFVGAENSKSENIETARKSPMYAKTVPVIVLMAMNPSLLNAKLPENFAEENNITFIAPAKAQNLDDTYVISPEIDKSSKIKNPYGWQIFDVLDIKQAKKIKPKETEYNVLFTSLKDKKPNEIDNIYLVPTSDMGRSISGAYEPPRVKALILHNVEGQKYCSVRTVEDVVDNNGNPTAFREREIILDNETAQEIFDIIQGHTDATPWVNKSKIEFKISNSIFTMNEKVVPRNYRP